MSIRAGNVVDRNHSKATAKSQSQAVGLIEQLQGRTQMKSKMLVASFMIGMLLVAAAASVETRAATAPGRVHEQPKTQTGRTNKNKQRREGSNVKKVALDAKKDTKDTGKKVGNGGKKAGEGIAKGSENVAKATGDGARVASRATVKGAKKTGSATAKAGKKIGRVFK